MSFKKQSYENLADSLIEKFNLRGIEGYYCDNAQEALVMAERFLTPDCTVSWGGSETLKEIGLIDALESADYVLYDRDSAKTPEEKAALYSKIVTADYFFMSSNAITLDGELVNIDGIGNRVACLITGPANGVRLGTNTPCAELGRCGNCLKDDCMCCEIVITRKSRIPGRIKVILVGEELGF